MFRMHVGRCLFCANYYFILLFYTTLFSQALLQNFSVMEIYLIIKFTLCEFIKI